MKKIPLTYFFFSIIFQTVLQGQNHDHIWLFGYNSPTGAAGRGGCVLDFNYDPPFTYEQERDMNFDLMVASTCDTAGNLLFYTNGIYMANYLHEPIENGDSLNPGEVAEDWMLQGYPHFQGGIIIEEVNSEHVFNLFHLKIEYDNQLGTVVTTVYRTQVDMNLNSGSGKVIIKNEELITNPNLGTITATKNANGRDWWIFVTSKSENKYYRFFLGPQGISNPEEIIIEPLFPNIISNGSIVFSPDGSKFARYEIQHGIYVYDFDRCTGEFSNPIFIELQDSNLGQGISFSFGSRFLYATTTNYIFQFDLSATNVAASLDTVAVYDGAVSNFPTTFFLSQLGPDGRIYINTTNNTDILHVINYPDKKGKACQVVQGGVQLPTRNRFTSQHFPNYRLGPLDGSPCDTLGLDNLPVAKFRYEQDTQDYLQVEFTDLSYYEPAEWSWVFGDNTTSQDTSPVHMFPQSGTYEVCLTVSNVNGEHTFCRTLSLGTVSSSEEAEQVAITVFPNPCREGVNIILNDYLPRDAKVMLYDAIGQRQKVQSVQTGWNTVQLDGLPAGIYFYEIWEGASPEPALGRVLLDCGKLVKVD